VRVNWRLVCASLVGSPPYAVQPPPAENRPPCAASGEARARGAAGPASILERPRPRGMGTHRPELVAHREALGARYRAVGRLLRRLAAEKSLALAGADGLIVCTKRGWPRANPAIKAAATACREMVRIGAMFGMTPASRTAIGNSAAHR
jgi:hypothetical protein